MRKTISIALTLIFLSLTGSALAAPKASKPVEDFRRTITARVEAVWGRIEKKLDAHTVSPDRRKAIRQTFDDAARPIFAEVDKAAADGAITREENARVMAMANALRGKVRGKLATARGEARRAQAADRAADRATERADRAPTPPVAAEKGGGKKGETPRHDATKPASPGKTRGEPSKAAKPKEKEAKTKGKAPRHVQATADSEE